MAKRRMFSQTVIDSDAFYGLSHEAQALYFHLGMQADDDGFLNNPKRIMRTIQASENSMEELIQGGYIITFESGVIAIAHWNLNNSIQKDRYHETDFVEEKASLKLSENRVYTKCIQNVSKLYPEISIDKTNIDKTNLDKINEEKRRKEKDSKGSERNDCNNYNFSDIHSDDDIDMLLHQNENAGI